MTQSTQEALQGCLTLADAAVQMGYRRAHLIWTQDVVFDSRTRMKCLQNTCTHYGQNFMCPPRLPAVEEYREVCGKFRIALLVQDESDLPAGLTADLIDQRFKTMSCQNLKHLSRLEQQAFRLGFPFAFSAGGGACKLCDPCKARLGEAHCAHPELARPSMEAIGIDIGATCHWAGFPSDFLPHRLLLTSLLYII